MNRAVVILLFTDDKQIVTISRKNNFNHFGLPGGKVQENETEFEAIIRECKEEIGIDLSDTLLVPIYSDYEGNYWTTAFIAPNITGELNNLSPEKDTIIKFQSENEFMECTPFFRYNDVLLDTFQYFMKRQIV